MSSGKVLSGFQEIAFVDTET